MTHISRPFQIALAAAVLLAGVWFFALRSTSPSGESSGGSSSSSAPAPSSGSSSAASSQSAPGGGTNTSAGKAYHGSAPGVAGLTHAIAKAQGAVKQSERNARQLQQKAARATGQAQTQQSQTQTRQRQSATKSSGATRAKSVPQARTQAPGVAAKPTKQALVEAELKHGHTVLVLFWNRKGSVDVAVRHQLSSLRSGNLAVHYSSAAEVGQYGEITRSLQVFQTPTMLVIDPNGNTKTLTGLVDTYAIRQAIAEAHTSK